MRWRVLGPVEVMIDGSALAIQRPQQRGVLAYLMLNADRVVTTEQLIDALWAGPPPSTARTVVQTCVSGIRRALRDADADDALTSQAGGYRLVVADGELDLAVFEDRLARSRTAAAEGRVAEAAELLRAGLDLWRGTPLTGAAGAYVEAAAAGLQEQWLVAYEELADLELALGRYGPLAAQLRPLVGAHPLRERLVGQLMLALAGCGQQAEALRVYADIRARLADDLGVEPGAELAAIQLRVLRQQVATAPADAIGPAVVTPRRLDVAARPAQLPPDVAAFAGRAAHLRQLDTLLPGDGADRPMAAVISAIAGTAGVGKTTLAVHWAHRVADRFADGQLYVNLRGFDPSGSPTSPSEAVRGFLDALGVPPERIPAGLDAQVGLYRSLLAGKRMLVVLDNARNAEQVRPLLPGAPGCLALVTSRNRLTSLVAVEGAWLLALDLLSATEARQLLAHRLGRSRIDAEPEAVDGIVAACARLPLSLAIVAARAAIQPGVPLAALAGELRAVRGRLDAFEGEDPVSDLRAVLSWSYHALGPDAARLFRKLGVHPGPDVGAAAAASLAGLPPREARPLLAELTRVNMLTEHAKDRFVFHDLLRAYAAELCDEQDPEHGRPVTMRRMLDHYLHTAHTAALLLDPLRDPITLWPPHPGVTPEDLTTYEQAQTWFAAEHHVLLAAQEAATGAFDAHAWRFAWAVTTFFDRYGHWEDWAATMRTALPAAQRLSDGLAQAYVHRYLGRAYARLRRYPDARAHLQRARELFGELGDPAGQANAHSNLGWVFGLEGRREEAVHHAKLGLDLFQAAGQTAGTARSLNEVGYMYAEMGDYGQALRYCQRALALVEELADLEGQAETWASLGYIHRHLGDHAAATAAYQRAVDISRDIGDRYNAALSLDSLGDTQRAFGDGNAARSAWQDALALLDQLGHPDADEIRAKLDQANHARLY